MSQPSQPGQPDPYGQPPQNPYGQPPAAPQGGQQYGQQYGQPPGPPQYNQYGQPGQQPGYGAPPQDNGPFFISVMGQEQGPLDFGQLAQMAIGKQIKSDAMVRRADGQQWFQAKEIPGLYSEKEFMTTALMSWFLGSFGVDRFYLGYTGLGVAKLLTCGGLGIWHIIDFILVVMRKTTDADGRPLR